LEEVPGSTDNGRVPFRQTLGEPNVQV
jgi:hypothetical protein